MAGFRTEERVIGQHTYRTTLLGALKGREVFIRVAKLLGPVVDKLEGATIGQAFAGLAQGLTDADLAFLCDAFGKVSDVVLPDGRAPRVSEVFDLHFSDNYLELFQWLAFCLEVNFSSFFRGAKAKLGSVGSVRP